MTLRHNTHFDGVGNSNIDSVGGGYCDGNDNGDGNGDGNEEVDGDGDGYGDMGTATVMAKGSLPPHGDVATTPT